MSVPKRLLAGWSGFQFPVEVRNVSQLQNVQTNFVAHPASYEMGTGVFFALA